MRIGYLGNHEHPWSTETDIRMALESLGHVVVPMQENKTSAAVLRNVALGSDLLLVTGTWDSIPLAEAIDIFLSCARADIPTATVHLDTFWGTSRGDRKWWNEAMFHTRHIFTADGDYQDQWAKMGMDHTWLRPGVRHTVGVGELKPEYACDVAFVGSDGHGYHDEWPYRRELVDKLEEICARRGWSFKNPGGRQPKVERDQMANFYASAKVTVGDSLCLSYEKSHYWSDRVYEATGRGALLIMPQLDALEGDFDGCLPMYPWGDFDKLEDIIEYFLEDTAENQATRNACFKLAQRRHLYTNRMNELLGKVIK